MAEPKPIDYKGKYRNLKRRLKMLVYENECFTLELRNAQKKLITLTRDKSFLLDRLLQYEKVEESSSECESTGTSDSEADTAEGGKRKRELITPMMPYLMENGELVTTVNTTLIKKKRYPPTRRIKRKVGDTDVAKSTDDKDADLSVSDGSLANCQPDIVVTTDPSKERIGNMTREELDRHLNQRPSSLFPDMNIHNVGVAPPEDIFSDDSDSENS